MSWKKRYQSKFAAQDDEYWEIRSHPSRQSKYHPVLKEVGLNIEDYVDIVSTLNLKLIVPLHLPDEDFAGYVTVEMVDGGLPITDHTYNGKGKKLHATYITEGNPDKIYITHGWLKGLKLHKLTGNKVYATEMHWGYENCVQVIRRNYAPKDPTIIIVLQDAQEYSKIKHRKLKGCDIWVWHGDTIKPLPFYQPIINFGL